MKNTFAPVNRIPPEVLSLIPDYLEVEDRDESLIALTHVCRSWREIFVSCPSLWTWLDFTDIEKTRVYIERSKCAPLEIHLELPYEEEAFLLAIPHIHRLKTLWVSGDPAELLPVLVEHFSCPLPLLNELEIDFPYDDDPTLPHGLFNGDFSSLHKLTLTGVTTALPWRDLSNLTTFNLSGVPEGGILLTQLLDFFESTSNLRHIQLDTSLPNSSDAPTERVVPLPHLKDLSMCLFTEEEQPILNHLSIPVGASLHLELEFVNEEPPFSSSLLESPGNLRNLSHITAVNLCFDPNQRNIRLNGPSGELCILRSWKREERSLDTGASQVIQYLDQFDISRTQWLTISLYNYRPSNPAQITKLAVHRILRPMEDLRTLMLIHGEGLPFIRALTPGENPDKVVLCPRLEEIIIYDYFRDTVRLDELVEMARERALRGTKLSAIKIINTTTNGPIERVLLPLREHVEHVEYRFTYEVPEWDALPN